MNDSTKTLLHTPLYALHIELGARMLAFAGYAMPVQYPAGLLAEHHHTRNAASLFDVSHMGQLWVRGAQAAAALESLMPADLHALDVDAQRYGLLLNDAGGILDDLMCVRRAQDAFFLIVNGACKNDDVAHLQKHIGSRCAIETLPDWALLALQGPLAADALQRLVPGVQELIFMRAGAFVCNGVDLYITRSGYSGEDGFEISLPGAQAHAFARALLQNPQVRPAGLGARNSLRLEAGLCLYGNDMHAHTTPAEAALGWAVAKARRQGGARAGGFPGADKVLAQIQAPQSLARQRVALMAQERIPVREGCALLDKDAQPIGEVTSGLLSPTLDMPVAMGYVQSQHAAVGSEVFAVVRGKSVAMRVCRAPFVPVRYVR